MSTNPKYTQSALRGPTWNVRQKPDHWRGASRTLPFDYYTFHTNWNLSVEPFGPVRCLKVGWIGLGEVVWELFQCRPAHIGMLIHKPPCLYPGDVRQDLHMKLTALALSRTLTPLLTESVLLVIEYVFFSEELLCLTISDFVVCFQCVLATAYKCAAMFTRLLEHLPRTSPSIPPSL